MTYVPFVPSPKRKGVRKASRAKQLKTLLRQASTPNAQAVSPNPLPPNNFSNIANAIKSAGAKAANVGKIVVGSAAAKVGLAALAIYGISEGLFARRAETPTVSELGEDFFRKYYPGESQILEEAPPPPFTGGQGQGVFYTIRARYFREDGTQARLLSGNIYGAISRFETSYEYIFGDPDAAFGTIVRYEVDGYDAQGNPFTATNDGTASAKVVGEAGKEISRWDGQPDVDGNIDTGNNVTATSTPTFIPSPTNNDLFAYRDSYVGGANFGFNDQYRLGDIPPPNKTIKPSPPENNIVNNLVEVLDRALGGKANATDLETVKAQLAEIDSQIDNLNLKQELDVNADISNADIPDSPNPAEETLKQETAKEPSKETTFETAGKTPIKVETVTDENGVKTETKTTTDGKVISIKRTIPAGLNIVDVSVEADPLGAEALKQQQLKFVGTPAKSGTGIETIPEPEALVQTPEIQDGEALGTNDLAKVAALIAATPILTNQGFTAAVEEAICNSTDGGCLKTGITDPLNANQGNIFDALNALGQGIDLSLLTTINNKLGDQIPGGIGGYLKKAWEAARIDKIINMANLLVATHNAAMLSRNLGETIGEVVNQGLSLLNIQDAEGNAIDVNAIVGNTVKGLIESLVPEAIRTNVSQTWLKVNRIHTAAVSLASAITSARNAFMEVQEITADWVAKIGNRHQEQGILEEDSYPWMREGIQFRNPYDGFLNNLNNVENVVSEASNFVNSAIELKDSVGQVATSQEQVQQSITDFANAKIGEETSKETESSAPDVSNSDLIEYQPPDTTSTTTIP